MLIKISFFKIIAISFRIALIAFIAFIIWLTVSDIKDKVIEKKKKKEEMLKKQRIEEWKKKSRNDYYSKLPNVYDHLSTQTLKKAYQLLETANISRPSFRDTGEVRRYALADWYDNQQAFLSLVNPDRKPLWYSYSYFPTPKIGKSSKPQWEDLDLKYMRNLLNKRK